MCLTLSIFEHTLCSSVTDKLRSDQLTKQKAGDTPDNSNKNGTDFGLIDTSIKPVFVDDLSDEDFDNKEYECKRECAKQGRFMPNWLMDVSLKTVHRLFKGIFSYFESLHFTKEMSLRIGEFGLGLEEGVVDGVSSTAIFVGDLVLHPIDTTCDLAIAAGKIVHAISPMMCLDKSYTSFRGTDHPEEFKG